MNVFTGVLAAIVQEGFGVFASRLFVFSSALLGVLALLGCPGAG